MPGSYFVTPPVGAPDHGFGHRTTDGLTTLCGLTIAHAVEWGQQVPRTPDQRSLEPGWWYAHQFHHYYGRTCPDCDARRTE